MGGPGADDDPGHRRPADQARLILAPVDPQLRQVVAGSPVRKQVGKIVEGGPATVDGGVEHLTDGLEETGGVAAGEISSRSERVNSSPVQGFVGVDVAQTRYRALIEKQCLDRRLPSGESPGQLHGCRWIRPGVGADTAQTRRCYVVLVVDGHEAEGAGIDELHDRAIIEVPDEMGVGILPVCIERPPPGHPQVSNHRLTVVQKHFEELAPPSYGLDPTAGEPGNDFLGRRVVSCGAHMADLHRLEYAANHRRFEVTSRYLDLWQLWQCNLPDLAVTVPWLMVIPPRQFAQVLGDAMNGLATVWKSVAVAGISVFVPTGILTVVVFMSTGAADFLDLVMNRPDSLQRLSSDVYRELAEPFFVAVGVAILLQVIAGVFVALASHSAVAAQIRGRILTPGEAIRAALNHYVRGLGAVLLVMASVTILVGLGGFIWLVPALSVGTPNLASQLIALLLLAVLIGPGVWAGVSASMTTSALAIESGGVLHSIRRSMRLVRGRWWATAGFTLIVGFLSGVATQLIQLVALPLVAVGEFGVGLAIAAAVGVLAQGLLVGAIAAMFTHWYVDLRARRETLSTENLS